MNASPLPPLSDAHGRTVSYLRISVTDRCNLRCRYCRDEESPFIPHESILRYEEIMDIIALGVRSGVRKVRFTGGEPFARKGFADFLEEVRGRFPGLSLRITTNGTLLGGSVDLLRRLGAAVNLSLDTLDRGRFADVTGRDLLPAVKESMAAMLEAGIPLKINAVAMRGVNDGELPGLAGIAMEHPVDVRFIEFMPMGESTIWTAERFWPAADILAEARRHWTLEPVPVSEAGGGRGEYGPAKLWRLRDASGRVSRGALGLITSVTQGFCGSCNRLRLTAEGNLRTCLFSDSEYPLRDVLRSEGIEAVERIMRAAVADKPLGSEILAARRGPVAGKRMSAIGG